jgi:hypothetical protein
MATKADNAAILKEMGVAAAPPRCATPTCTAPAASTTRSCSRGEIDMLLDDSEVHLNAGDILVQQGTNHAWVNRGSAVCRIAFVLIDGKEAPPSP